MGCEKIARQNSGKASAAKQVRRSRDEIALFEMCASEWNLVAHNEPLVDGWDADIIMREQKLAVLWHGIWHREQLSFSNHSLSQVQTRDRLKTKALESEGWKVAVFHDNEWTPATAFEALKEMVRAAEFEST